jgi:hypothetical protein
MRRTIALFTVLLLTACSEGGNAPSRSDLESFKDEAAVFAIRTLADAGLMDPHSDAYDYKRITTISSGWVVSFDADDCRSVTAAGEGSCRSRGSAIVQVALEDGIFKVTALYGPWPQGIRPSLLGIQGRPHQEDPHLEYLPAHVWGAPAITRIEAIDLYVGSIPAPGSAACTPHLKTAGGRTLDGHTSNLPLPQTEGARSGGFFSGPIVGARGLSGRGYIDCTEPSRATHQTDE